ncbi:MAG: permease-like cell division protein FtsX [Bacilli bacterium]
MRISTVQRHFRESFRSVIRNTWSTVASVSSVTVTLILVAAFLMLMMNINHIATRAENDLVIRVMVELTADKDQQQILKAEIDKISEVQSIKYSSKDDEAKILEEDLGGTFGNLQGVANPLYDVYEIRVSDPNELEKTAKTIEKLEYVNTVEYGEGKIDNILSTVGLIRNIGFVLIVGLIFTAMFLISNTIKVTIFARRREIEIMRLVGATNSFIRWPFLIEGFIIGSVGSILPIVFVIFGYESLYNLLVTDLGTSFFSPLPVYPFVIQVSILLFLIGSLIGMWGSVFSIRKFLKI